MLAARDYCSNVSSTSSITEPQSGPDLRRFVLHLEGEEELVEVMMKDIHKTTNQLFHVGEKKEPKHVIELITEKSSILEGFKRVTTFHNDQVSSLHNEKTTPYGWALPNMDMLLVKKFIGALSEGLYYVKFIECNIDKKGKLIKVKRAAKTMWHGVDLYGKWLDVDLYKLSHQSKSPRETLETLAEDAGKRYGKYKTKYRDICNREPPSSWPIEVLASNAMYRISQTVLLNYGSIEDLRSEILFEELTGTISDILGAYFTNLPYAISAKCSNSTVAERKDSVRDAVEMLGRTKKIIELLAEKIPTVDFSQSRRPSSRLREWSSPLLSVSSLSCTQSRAFVALFIAGGRSSRSWGSSSSCFESRRQLPSRNQKLLHNLQSLRRDNFQSRQHALLVPKEEDYIEWFKNAGFKDVKLKRIGPKWYRGVRRHGLIMGCSLISVKPFCGDSPFKLGLKVEDVKKPLNPLVFLSRLILGAIAAS
ncbi:hypothetical protein AHAS_AhasUnG0040900 [Arachis hypogaea]